MQKSNTLYRLLIIALTTLFVVVNGYFFLHDTTTSCGCDLADRPTIGNPQAKVSVVFFEDLHCPECIRFSNTIFPMIQAQYIEKGLIQFSVVPVSFMESSEELTYRLNCLHHSDPYAFWGTLKEAMKQLETGGNYDLSHLRACDHPQHRLEIEENTAHATALLHGDLVAPAFFVNGRYIGAYTYTKLINAIEEAISS